MEKLGKEKLIEISKKIGEQLYDQYGISTVITLSNGNDHVTRFEGEIRRLNLLIIANDCINILSANGMTKENIIKALNQPNVEQQINDMRWHH